MELVRSIFYDVRKIFFAYLKHEWENTLRSPHQDRDFNIRSVFAEPKPVAPEHQRIISSTDGRLAATVPGGWFSETGDEYIGCGTSMGAMVEGIGNLKTGDVALHITVRGKLSEDESVRGDKAMFEQIIRDNDTTIYADANWSTPTHYAITGKNAVSITGRSEYGDQTLILMAQSGGHHILIQVDTAPGEWERVEEQARGIAESIRYLG
jgi:hypothetical protein